MSFTVFEINHNETGGKRMNKKQCPVVQTLFLVLVAKPGNQFT